MPCPTDTLSVVGWRFQRRRKLFPGVTLNVGKRGPGISVGRRGARGSIGPSGVGATLTLLGTGLSYVWRRRRR
jgi:uncharacterized protein (TIGR03382 family)